MCDPAELLFSPGDAPAPEITFGFTCTHFKDRVLSSAALQTVLDLDLTLSVGFLQSSELQLMLSG